MNDITLRPATEADLPRLREIAAETPAFKFREDLFAWPTFEVAVAERGGQVVGFGYVEAIPECHLVLARKETTREGRWAVVEALHRAALSLMLKLKLPAIRYPVHPDVPELALRVEALPCVQGDPRVHLMAVAGDTKW